MTLAIRSAVSGDRPALIELWVEGWQAAMPQIDFEARRGWIAGHLDGLVAGDAALLVACWDKEPAGFITVDDAGCVDQLVVALAHQRKGVARALLSAARDRHPGPLRLTVNAGNEGAVCFYEREGFRPVGRGVNPRSGLPVIHMEG